MEFSANRFKQFSEGRVLCKLMKTSMKITKKKVQVSGQTSRTMPK
jgi:hypothetical protein